MLIFNQESRKKINQRIIVFILFLLSINFSALAISECEGEAKTTKVEFKIIPKEGTAGKEVKIFERIRKDCVDDLDKLLTKLEGGDTDIIMKADPLIVWTFGNIDKVKRYFLFAFGCLLYNLWKFAKYKIHFVIYCQNTYI